MTVRKYNFFRRTLGPISGPIFQKNFDFENFGHRRVLFSYQQPIGLKNSSVNKTSFSYFHKMRVTVLRMQFPKLKVFHRDYTNFLTETFINFLKFKLGLQFISPEKNGFLNFYKIYTETLNKYASRERKAIRKSQSLFINKEI